MHEKTTTVCDLGPESHSGVRWIPRSPRLSSAGIKIALGVVAKLHFGDGRSRYELLESLTKSGHHHHLVCSICKRVINYDDFASEELELLKKVERKLSKKHGFHIMGHAIQFYGKCSRCREAL
jgi:Fe2+ or Zn2+ uptake regulation protein